MAEVGFLRCKPEVTPLLKLLQCCSLPLRTKSSCLRRSLGSVPGFLCLPLSFSSIRQHSSLCPLYSITMVLKFQCISMTCKLVKNRFQASRCCWWSLRCPLGGRAVYSTPKVFQFLPHWPLAFSSSHVWIPLPWTASCTFPRQVSAQGAQLHGGSITAETAQRAQSMASALGTGSGPTLCIPTGHA